MDAQDATQNDYDAIKEKFAEARDTRLKYRRSGEVRH